MADTGIFWRGRAQTRVFFGLAAGFCTFGVVSWAWPVVTAVVAGAAALAVWWWCRTRRRVAGFPIAVRPAGPSWAWQAGEHDPWGGDDLGGGAQQCAGPSQGRAWSPSGADRDAA